MSEYIEVGQPLQFTDPNTPTRVGEIVENVSDIYNIPSPRLGMQVFVKSEKKIFVITSLKSKVIGGVDVPEAAVEAFEPVGAKSITWNNDTVPSNMNDFVVAGVYDIKGEHKREDDNLPILNIGSGHSFNARLTVLDSSISGSGENDDKCITQVLSFSNRLGQGEVYIRTGKGSSLDNLTWENWSTLQRNVNVDDVTSLDHLVDNGIYSGVLTPTGETFVLVVINNYALASQYGTQKCISQFKYSVSPTGAVAFGKRVKIGNADFPAEWDILNRNEIDKMLADAVVQAIATVTNGAPEAFDTLKEIADWIANDETGAVALANAISTNAAAITAERTRAIGQEGEISQNAIAVDSMGYSTTTDDVSLEYETLDGKSHGSVTFPAATTESAGVMSAEDKVSLDTATSRALRTLFVAAGAAYNDTDKIEQVNLGFDKDLGGTIVQHLPHHYRLNSLGDITEEEMIKIYNLGRFTKTEYSPLSYVSVRTNLGRRGQANASAAETPYMAYSSTNLITINLCVTESYEGIFLISGNAFNGCSNLRAIYGRLIFNAHLTTAFVGCTALERIKIYDLKFNVILDDSPLVSKRSVLYMIQNAKPTKAITITLHPDAYARLAEDADIVAALAAQPLVTLVSA